MNRTRWAGLVVVLVLLAGAFVIGRSGGSSADPRPGTDSELERLRVAADLAPCPTGLGPELPDVTAPCLGGGPDVRLRDPIAMPTVVNVWGSWCGPCREEIPDFQAVSDKLAGKVAFVGVDTADTDRSALSFAAFIKMRYASVVDTDGRISAAYGAGTPKTLFLDSTGKVTHVERGQVASAAELEQLISTHLGVS